MQSEALFQRFDATSARKALNIIDKTSRAKCCSLKKMFEDKDIMKLMFDIRANAFGLNEQYKIKISGIYDLQVLYAYRFHHDVNPEIRNREKWERFAEWEEEHANDDLSTCTRFELPPPPLPDLKEALEVFSDKSLTSSDSLYSQCKNSHSNVDHFVQFNDDKCFSKEDCVEGVGSAIAAYDALYHEWGTDKGRQIDFRQLRSGKMESVEAIVESCVLSISEKRAESARKNKTNQGKSATDIMNWDYSGARDRDFWLPEDGYKRPICEDGTGERKMSRSERIAQQIDADWDYVNQLCESD